MIEQLIARAADNPAIWTSILALGVFYIVRFVFQRKSFEAPKLYDEKTSKDITQLHTLSKGEFHKYKNQVFKLGESHGDVVVLPTKYIEELKALPKDVLSFQEETEEMLISKYNLLSPVGDGYEEEGPIKAIKNELTRSLGSLMGDIYDEMLYAFETEMPPCDDWTEVNINDKLVQIVALVSGRIFIGNPLNRDPDYLDCIIRFTMNVFFATESLRKIPWYLRWTAKYWTKEVIEVHKCLEKMQRVMAPVHREQLARLKEGTAPSNMNTWNMVNCNEQARQSLRIQAHLQLSLSMAAIHTTSMTSTHALFDLAARPEYAEPLRKEIATVKETEEHEYLSKVSMPKLKKLDSFLRESQRINPLSILNMRRKVKKDITLHDGVVLPAGTHIAFASGQIASDSTLWKNPEEFDGFRFSNLRQQPGSENKYQFVTTGKDHLQFGHGIHACPGRFFANNEIKLILIHIIENYEIKFPEDVGRPKNHYSAGGYTPDRTQKFLMKKIKR